ncbi:MAG: chemotaxis protein CheB [Bacteroidia bacterium]
MTQNINERHDPEDLYVIAIGASAGGMEAIHLLFDHTPEDGVAYVIIQHLSPDHKSFMAELLAQHSKLKISVAENETYVEPNHVYLMPRGKNMTIRNKMLLLTDIRTAQPNTAIDIFFDSLAEDQGDKSIAVILSGTGTDGTKGIAAIKRNGGFVIVQDPESAKFNGMPNSAIESGNVDIVLPPERIPDEIIAYLKRDILESNFSHTISENDEAELLNILELIQQNTPLDFSDYKRPTIIRRIVIRMTRNKIATLGDYTEFLKANPSEIDLLAKDFLISVTKFFRDKEAFEKLKKEVIPEIIENKLLVDTLKVWVVGCATGEEAYSLAILIVEHLTELKKSLDVKIFASDIDKPALLHASKGVYPASIANDVSEERLHKFFIKEDNKYKVKDNIRKMIIFADHDIIKQPPYGKIDLISCRNLLIYINPILQKKIIASLHFCLNLGGFLFLGPSESLGEVKKSFKEIDKKWKIYKSIEVVRNLRDTTYSTPGPDQQLVKLRNSPLAQKSIIKNNLTEIIHHTLLEESGYEAGICVNADFEIIQTFGNYEKYLLPKIFNFNLLEMLPEELSIATSTALRKAVKQKKAAAIKSVKFKRNRSKHSVSLFVKPFLPNNTAIQTVLLVLFKEEKTKKIAEKDIEVFSIEAHTSRHLEDLKDELAETKNKLKEAYDALEVSSDNISSYNEELISSNEEMQSTNEELQSVNEELQTVNNEYQLKIKELGELYDDLNNYFKSTINGQLYVDKNLVVRKFTPSAIRQINLKESDIGRPLSDISTNIRFSTMVDDIYTVIAGSSTIEKEVQTTDGRWYQMMVIPYIKQKDNKNDGAIITFNDITEIKRVQDKLTRINEDHNNFIYTVSHDLKGPVANLEKLVDFLQKSPGNMDKEDKEIISKIDLSVLLLKDTINELSDITKIESDIDVHDNISVADVLEEVKSSIKDKLLEANVTINIDLKEQQIPFSKKNLRSILLNLLTNAIKYQSPDRTPEVTIKTEKYNEYIMLSVRDNGLGLDKDKISEIFTKFNRRHYHVEGSGIGLYLTKRIITNAGGEIEVESELGKGSVFKVFFRTKSSEEAEH